MSVIAVNWIGWRTTTLSPGFGLHANLRYEGDVLREYSALDVNRAGPTRVRRSRSGRGSAGGTSTSGRR